MWRTAAHREVVGALLTLSHRLGCERFGRDGLRYGTPQFDTASAVAVAACSGGWLRAGGQAIVAGRYTTEALLALLGLPVVTVELEPWEERAWHADPFPPAAMPIFTGYLGQAVLDLTPTDDEYLEGHHRRQLRTRTRRAEAEGVRAVELEDFVTWMPYARAVLECRPGGPEELSRMAPPEPRQRAGWYAALDRNGEAVAVAAVALFGQAGVVFSLVGRPGRSEAGSARYLLHNIVRSRLRQRGVRHLLAGAALRLPEGLQLFQHLLGYEVRNLRVVLRTAPARGTSPRAVMAGDGTAH